MHPVARTATSHQLYHVTDAPPRSLSKWSDEATPCTRCRPCRKHGQAKQASLLGFWLRLPQSQVRLQMPELPCRTASPRGLRPGNTSGHSCEALWGWRQEDTARRVRLRKAAASLVMADEQRGGGQQNNELLAMQRASKKAATVGGDRHKDRRQDKQPPAANAPDGPDPVRQNVLLSCHPVHNQLQQHSCAIV